MSAAALSHFGIEHISGKVTSLYEELDRDNGQVSFQGDDLPTINRTHLGIAMTGSIRIELSPITRVHLWFILSTCRGAHTADTWQCQCELE